MEEREDRLVPTPHAAAVSEAAAALAVGICYFEKETKKG